MGSSAAILQGQYTDVDYIQFRSSRWIQHARTIAGVLTWPLVLPLALLSRASDFIFRTMSECLSLVPYLIGVIVRGEFYRFALRSCGKNVVIEFGAVFMYRDVMVGDNVCICRYTIIHHCDIGSYSLIGEGSSLLSGSKQHNFERIDIPMALQRGQKKRISIGDDCWIGVRSVVMDDVGRGSLVGAGAVVTKPIAEFTIAVGNPARPVGQRGKFAEKNRASASKASDCFEFNPSLPL